MKLPILSFIRRIWNVESLNENHDVQSACSIADDDLDKPRLKQSDVQLLFQSELAEMGRDLPVRGESRTGGRLGRTTDNIAVSKGKALTLDLTKGSQSPERKTSRLLGTCEPLH